jgi:hypothetical protein
MGIEHTRRILMMRRVGKVEIVGMAFTFGTRYRAYTAGGNSLLDAMLQCIQHPVRIRRCLVSQAAE